MRPADLPDSTSETVDCDTPARRATSTLVTLESARAMDGYNHVDGRSRRGGGPAHGRDLRRAAAARRRGAARRAGVRARGVPAVLGRAVAELAGAGRARSPAARCAAPARSSWAAGSGCRASRPRSPAAACLPPTGRPTPSALTAHQRRAQRRELETLVCCWTEPAPLLERAPWDLVLASDVLYEARNGDALLDLLPRLGHGRVARRPRPQAGRAFLDAAASRLADRVLAARAGAPQRRGPPA